MSRSITWFSTSPDAGDPSCFCSWCEQQITAEQAPAIRLFDSDTNREARFHRGCYGAAIGQPMIEAPDDGDGWDDWRDDERPETACIDCGRPGNDACQCCGGWLCGQCSEVGAGFCRRCPTQEWIDGQQEAQ